MATAAFYRPEIEFPATANPDMSAAQILSALSFALDLNRGAMPGHALRTCVLGMRLAHELSLSSEQLLSLYCALLLKDLGSSSNAARLRQLLGGGDKRRAKPVRSVGLEDWARPARPTLRLLPQTGPLQRASGMAKIGLAHGQNNVETMQLGREPGAHIRRRRGLGDATAEAMRCLLERRAGGGISFELQMDSRADSRIDSRNESRNESRIHSSLELSILAVAQHLDRFASAMGTESAIQDLKERSGRWLNPEFDPEFDPELVRIAVLLHRQGSLWPNALPHTPESEVRKVAIDLAPHDERLRAADIDLICETFSDVVDAKSTFTHRHSLGVTEAAVKIAAQLGLSSERRRLVKRAALLHDLGKLRVPKSILDKPGKLNPRERAVIRQHPRLTHELLARVESFRELAAIAGAHHEKLDGSGYPNRLSAKQLPLEARIIAVADVFSALTEHRSYCPGIPVERALPIVARETPQRLDADCYEALAAVIR